MTGKNSSTSAFEKYAHEYDWITNAAQRESYHAKEVAAIIDRFHPASVLDAGCATGLTSLLFARQGIETVGLDRSRGMIDQANKKHAGESLPMSFRVGSFEKLPKSLHGKFDLIACLANAISGVGSIANLNKSMAGFYNVLRPGGTLLLQLLNYEAVKEGVPMPVKATENNGVIYSRYSIRRGNTLQIHVVRVDLNQNPPTNEPFCHEFENFSPAQIDAAVKRAGFNNSRHYADLYLKKKFGVRSRDLVLTCTRPE